VPTSSLVRNGVPNMARPQVIRFLRAGQKKAKEWLDQRRSIVDRLTPLRRLFG